MSSETLAAIVGAVVGSAATLILTLLGRWWVFRDSQEASRRVYAAIVATRLQRFVSATTEAELDEINDETFEISSMAVHLPRWDTSVHLWFVFHQSRLFNDAVAKVRAGKVSDNQVQLFGDALDVLEEITGWARGQWSRSGVWFWLQLRTTDRYQWAHAKKLGKAEGKKIDAARRAQARDGRAKLCAERKK